MLWGLKTEAVFDVWSVEHLASGISVSAFFIRWHARYLQRLGLDAASSFRDHTALIWVACAAYVWETLEHYLEEGLAGAAVERWFQGVEHWSNRLVSDPLLVMAGYFVAQAWPRSVAPARAFSVAWLATHIFLFPHSMYLHEVMAR